MLTLATVAVLAISASARQGEDPSLRVDVRFPTARVLSMLPDNVMDHDGVVLNWNPTSEEFALEIDSSEISDLVTFTNAEDWPSFEGLFVGGVPTVFGSVIPIDENNYTVELTRPSVKPNQWDVEHNGTTPSVVATRECDCTDKITLTCITNHCNERSSCATTYTCKWKNVGGGSGE